MLQLLLGRNASPTPLVLGPPSVRSMRLSPDGRAASFVVGDETRQETYVSTVKVRSLPVLVTKEFSRPARWDREGSRIYYVIDDTMMTQTVSMVPSLKLGAPEKLFKLRRTAYLQDVSLDGRFLLLEPLVRAGQHPITVWTGAIVSTQR